MRSGARHSCSCLCARKRLYGVDAWRRREGRTAELSLSVSPFFAMFFARGFSSRTITYESQHQPGSILTLGNVTTRNELYIDTQIGLRCAARRPARGAAKTGANCTATRKPKYKFKQIVGRLARCAVGPTVAAASAVARGRGRSET